MTWGRIATYYVLAGVLGGFFFLSEEPSPTSFALKVEPVVPQHQFLPIARAEIGELEITRVEGTLHFKFNGKSWDVIRPAGAPVTSGVVASFLEDLTPEKEIRIMDNNAEDLAVYGLDKPSSTIIVRNGDRSQEATVLVGSLNPSSSAYYAHRSDQRTVVLLGYNIGYYGDLMFESARQKK